MKATGIVRKIDELGRVVIPKELRKVMNLPEGTPFEIYVGDNDRIVLKKYEPNCCFCGGYYRLQQYNGKLVCGKCVEDMWVALP